MERKGGNEGMAGKEGNKEWRERKEIRNGGKGRK